MKTVRLALCLTLLLPLAGCGFHLRNAVSLPADLGPVAVVSSDPYSPLGLSVARLLESAGATAADEGATEGIAKLELLSERWADTPIAIDQFGRAQEYSLRYAVVFRMVRADGTALVPQQAIEMSRDYVAPPTDAVGSNSERELLVREMRRDMSAAIMRRVDAAVRGGARGP